MRAQAATFEYKFGHDQPVAHPLNVAATEFANAVRRESNGRLNIKVFPDSTLGNDTSMTQQVQTEALEMLLEGVATISSIVPVANLGFTGFAFADWRSAVAANDGAVGALVRRGLAAKGVVALERTWPNGFVQVTTWNRAIRNPEDLPGLKLRVSLSQITVDMWKTLGASAVPINPNELYTDLQTHLVDGNIGPLVDFLARKTYEVQRYLSITNHQFAVYFFLINGEKWQALPPDLQAILRRNANLYGAREERQSQLQGEAALDLLVRHGLVMNRADPAPFRIKLAPYYARWKAEFGPTAWAALEQYSGRLG